MNLGKILGSVSPAFGMASGKGLFGNKGVMGSISPLLGMMSGQGLGGALGGMGGLGGMGLLQMLMGHGMGGQDEGDEDRNAKLQAMLSGSRMPGPMSSVEGGNMMGPFANYLNRFGG